MPTQMNKRAGHDLHIIREFGASRQTIWRCWSEPELFKKWFCPLPWTVTSCELALRAGGQMDIVMEGPNGERVENLGMYLYVDPGIAMVFTDGYRAGFLPQADPFMTGYLLLESLPNGRTRMTWGAKHPTEEKMNQHLEMGFDAGWNAAADQLGALSSAIY